MPWRVVPPRHGLECSCSQFPPWLELECVKALKEIDTAWFLMLTEGACYCGSNRAWRGGEKLEQSKASRRLGCGNLLNGSICHSRLPRLPWCPEWRNGRTEGQPLAFPSVRAGLSPWPPPFTVNGLLSWAWHHHGPAGKEAGHGTGHEMVLSPQVTCSQQTGLPGPLLLLPVSLVGMERAAGWVDQRPE